MEPLYKIENRIDYSDIKNIAALMEKPQKKKRIKSLIGLGILAVITFVLGYAYDPMFYIVTGFSGFLFVLAFVTRWIVTIYRRRAWSENKKEPKSAYYLVYPDWIESWSKDEELVASSLYSKNITSQKSGGVRYLLYSDHGKENRLYIIKKSLFQKGTMEAFEQFYQEKIKPRITDLDE